MKNITVMMSTFNGELYLKEQIESILCQEDVNVRLVVRDDGSSDNTIKMLKNYKKDYDNIEIIEGENIGYIKSFLWLVDYVDVNDNMYYAFADQDDYWHPQKLISAIKMIDKEDNIPIMYYSDLNVVDENRNFIRRANVWEGKFDKFRALMFIAVRGCTIVYNSALQKIIITAKPDVKSSHDSFITLLTHWTGKVVYDKNAYIDYRQTGNNTSITGTSQIDAFKKNIKYSKRRFRDKSNRHQNDAKELLKCYSDYLTSTEEIEKVAYYNKSLSSKFSLLKDKRYFTFHTSINLLNKILIVFNKL